MNSQMLLDLAGHRDPDSRAQLVQKLSDLFLEGAERPSISEQELFSEVLMSLLDWLETEDQISASSRFADAQNTPHSLARELAFSEARIAMPILERSTVLQEEDLIEIAKGQSEEHLMGLSRRSTLSAALTDEIIDREMSKPITSASKNQGANFSQLGFEKMLELAEQGAREIAQSLSSRTDIPDNLADKLLDMLPVSAQNRFKELRASHHEELAEALKLAAEDALEDSSKKQEINQESQSSIEQIRSGEIRYEDVLSQLASQKKVDSICAILADLVRVKARYIHNVFHKTDATAFVVTCRSIGIDANLFGELFELRGDVLMKQYDVNKAIDDYLLIDKTLADETMEHLRQREQELNSGN